MVEDYFGGLTQSACPICDAADAYVAPADVRDDYFVECVNCGVYTASRKAFRHFEYLRWRSDPQGLVKLDRLASALRDRPPGQLVRLEYDTWHTLIEPAEPETHEQEI